MHTSKHTVSIVGKDTTLWYELVSSKAEIKSSIRLMYFCTFPLTFYSPNHFASVRR